MNSLTPENSRDNDSAAFVCLQCGRRAVVPHGEGFKCRDCGTEEPFNPIVQAYECGWCFDTGIHHYNTDDMDRLTMPCPNRDCSKSPDWWHKAADANAQDEAWEKRSRTRDQ